MRLEKSYPQEEWLTIICEVMKFFHCQISCYSVRIASIRDIRHFVWFHLLLHALPIGPISITKKSIPACPPYVSIKQKLIPAMRHFRLGSFRTFLIAI